MLDNIKFNAKFEASFGTKFQIPKSDLPEIVFSGRSNVGKSSLINAIINRKNLAKTSSHPGKTATMNFYALQGFRFVDLPGYGYAKVGFKVKQRWAELVETYFRQNRKIALVIQLIDARHAPSKDDMSMLNFLCNYNFPFVIVPTKVDKLNKTDRNTRELELKNELMNFNKSEIIYFSSITKEGVETVRSVILKALNNVHELYS